MVLNVLELLSDKIPGILAAYLVVVKEAREKYLAKLLDYLDEDTSVHHIVLVYAADKIVVAVAVEQLLHQQGNVMII